MRKTRLLLLAFLLGLICCRNTSSSAVSHSAKKEMPDSMKTTHPVWTSVNSFDMAVINFFQRYAHRNEPVDNFLRFFTYNNFFQGGVLMIAFWWLWFLRDQEKEKERRVKIILALASSFIAIFIGRIIVHITPERLRPIINPELSLVLPYNVRNEFVDHLSSFPSDHAVLFYAVATGLLMVSRRVGILALFYTTFFILATRIYCSYHYATDIIAGAVVGIVVTYLVCKNSLAQKLGEKIYTFSKQQPQLFYPIFFLLTYQLANLFEEIRNALAFVLGSF